MQFAMYEGRSISSETQVLFCIKLFFSSTAVSVQFNITSTKTKTKSLPHYAEISRMTLDFTLVLKFNSTKWFLRGLKSEQVKNEKDKKTILTSNLIWVKRYYFYF